MCGRGCSLRGRCGCGDTNSCNLKRSYFPGRLWLVTQYGEVPAVQLQFRCPVRHRRHINLLELHAVLEVERRSALRRPSSRILIGIDSQVVLGALLKGRTASPPLNRMLQRSLPHALGGDLYGSYGYVPSLANVADDPTRGAAIRPPSYRTGWRQLCKGSLNCLTSPQELAGLPGRPKALHAELRTVCTSCDRFRNAIGSHGVTKKRTLLGLSSHPL